MKKRKLKEQTDKFMQCHYDIAGFFNEYSKQMGISLTELKVLWAIKNNIDCTQKQIVQSTYLPKQTVNAIVKNFIDNNIVEVLSESTEDKRQKVINFTKDGELFANEIISKANEYHYNALEALGEENCRILLDLLQMFRDNLKREE